MINFYKMIKIFNKSTLYIQDYLRRITLQYMNQLSSKLIKHLFFVTNH